MEEGVVQAIQALYKNSSSAVLSNSHLREFLTTTAGVRQECLLSPTLFNSFLEKIMQETLHDQNTSISTGGRPYETYDLLTTSILEAAAMVNFKNSQADS